MAVIPKSLELGDLIHNGEQEAVQKMLQQNPSLLECIAGRFKVTPFLRASLSGQLSIMQKLVQKNCNVFATDNDGYNAVHLAAMYGHTDILAFLLDVIPEKFNQPIKYSLETPINFAAQRNQLEAFRFLAQYSDLNKDLHGGVTLLEIMCESFLYSQILLEAGAEINERVMKKVRKAEVVRLFDRHRRWRAIKSFLFVISFVQLPMRRELVWLLIDYI